MRYFSHGPRFGLFGPTYDFGLLSTLRIAVSQKILFSAEDNIFRGFSNCLWRKLYLVCFKAYKNQSANILSRFVVGMHGNWHRAQIKHGTI